MIVNKDLKILRRSAGIPFAFQAILRAEPPDARKVLLTRTMQFLFQVATNPKSYTEKVSQNCCTHSLLDTCHQYNEIYSTRFNSCTRYHSICGTRVFIIFTRIQCYTVCEF